MKFNSQTNVTSTVEFDLAIQAGFKRHEIQIVPRNFQGTAITALTSGTVTVYIKISGCPEYGQLGSAVDLTDVADLFPMINFSISAVKFVPAGLTAGEYFDLYMNSFET